ncbi:hypothetical protein EDC01DRAFT_609031 [Geopyxis carbonaria]|nr:hypothetical protein EDC01DRAFT_609031 [Geopyxis carbonaria]
MFESFRNPIVENLPRLQSSHSHSGSNTHSRQASRTTTTINQATQPIQPPKKRTSTRTGATMIVPATINSSKQNLAEFAAQMTCLFWFESTPMLHKIAESPKPHPQAPLPIFSVDATPTSGFRKWVTTILATTQVSQNVVLLALLFVYRLKKLNPQVQGKPGSEFRLFTVALMLGNKFLDDNTYTNKTWAEVSGINVQEIHIMEVEFLSNMRYSLYVGEAEWREWHTKLGRLWYFYDRASKASMEMAMPSAANFAPSIPTALPSPPPSNSSSPPFRYAGPPVSSSMSATVPQYLPVPSALNPPHVPHMAMPLPDFDPLQRKRSFDYNNAMQPPAKRMANKQPPKLSVSVPQYAAAPIPSTHISPVPRVAVSDGFMSQHYQQPQQHHQPQLPRPNISPVAAVHPSYQAQLPLPGARSISMVYNHSPVHATAPPMMSMSHQNTLPPYNSAQTSPYAQSHSVHHSAASSPTTPVFASHSQRSPTWILGNRDSPYRPVRTVNTLLVPPHSAAPQPQQLGYEQMHYQPLQKARSEYRTGTVPYMPTEVGWNQSWADQSSNVSY